MRLYLILLLLLSFVVLSSSAFSQAATPLQNLCPTIKPLEAPVQWATVDEPGFRNDPRYLRTSLLFGLMADVVPRMSCVRGYDSRGRLVHKLGLFARNGMWIRARFYSGYACGDRKRARDVQKALHRSPLFLKLSRNNCLMIPWRSVTKEVGDIFGLPK